MTHSPGLASVFSPSCGGMLMTADVIQTAAIMAAMRAGVRFMAYWSGRVMTQ